MPLSDSQHHLLLKHEALTEKIIGAFFDVYNELGYGFLEHIYQQAFAMALESARLEVNRQYPIPVFFRGAKVADYRADLVVARTVLVELKAAQVLIPAFEKQLLNYLRATDLQVGLLFNFGPKPEFKRLVFENMRKNIRVHPRHPRSSASKGVC